MPSVYYPAFDARIVSEYPNDGGQSRLVDILDDEGALIGRGWPGPIIDSALAFDEVRLHCIFPGDGVHPVFVHNAGVQVSLVAGNFEGGPDRAHFDPEFSEVAEIRRRVHAGTCRVTYYDDTSFVGTKELHELDHSYWRVATVHPFYGEREHAFFHKLVQGMEYVAATDTAPAEFHFPGKVVGAAATSDPNAPLERFRAYKRDDAASVMRPNVMPNADRAALIAALNADGWYELVPAGPRRLHSMDIERFTDHIDYQSPMRLYRNLDSTAWIHSIALRYKTWEDNRPADHASDPTYASTAQWWRGWIGRAWHSKPFTTSQFIFYGSDQTSTERLAIDVMDWMVGHMEEWLQEPNGIEDFRTRHDRLLLQVQFTDFTFAHVKLSDGAPGDRLSNGQQRLDQTGWDNFRNAKYLEALAGQTGT